MSQDKRYVVPSGMFEFVNERFPNPTPAAVGQILNFGLRWLSGNPRVPTPSQVESMARSLNSTWSLRDIPFIVEWQRRMFLASEPEVPEEIKDLLTLAGSCPGPSRDEFVNCVIEAFRRGQGFKVKP
jgi:hypothetical protein